VFGLSLAAAVADFSTASVLRVTVKSSVSVELRVELQSNVGGATLQTTELGQSYTVGAGMQSLDFDFSSVLGQFDPASTSNLIMYVNGGESMAWSGTLTFASLKQVSTGLELLSSGAAWWDDGVSSGSASFVAAVGTSAGTVAFSTAAVSVAETGPTAILTLTRTGGSTGAITVYYHTMDATAVAGLDYTGATGSVLFAAGETSKQITFAIIDDTLFEEDTEMFSVELARACDGAVIGTQSSVSVSITENDLCTSGYYVVKAEHKCNQLSTILPNGKWWFVDVDKAHGWQPMGVDLETPIDYSSTAAVSIVARAPAPVTMRVELVDCPVPNNCTENTATNIGDTRIEDRYHISTLSFGDSKGAMDFSSIDQIRFTVDPSKIWSGRIYFAVFTRHGYNDDISCDGCADSHGWWGVKDHGVQPLTIFSGCVRLD
jgi:hypothetical protein